MAQFTLDTTEIQIMAYKAVKGFIEGCISGLNEQGGMVSVYEIKERFQEMLDTVDSDLAVLEVKNQLK